MVRQARSEATRKKIVSAALDLFAEVGYHATGLGDIIERAEMTKGALYYHFDSKEALATAIIEEGANTALTAFRNIGEPSAPALENMIHGVFVVADLIRTDKMVRTGAQLLRAFGEFNEATVLAHGDLLAEMVTQARRAIVEDDLRDDLDPKTVGEVIVGAMLGAELFSNVSSGGADLIDRIARTWSLLLPALATEGSLPYLREFLARESMRHSTT
jgi:AcrR family transcriptional regulator